MNSNITFIDLFCGTGGFAQGFCSFNDRFKPIFALDNNPFAASTAQANHKNCLVEVDDIRKTTAESVDEKLNKNKVNLIIGGPPCQGFSSLRPFRASTNTDDRNDLYLEFSSYVEHFRPKVVVMENVVGLLTHDSGNTLDKVLTRFTGLGYSVDWRILNAANFGVPQKRERFIMIAARENGPIIFPDPTHHFNGKVIGHKDRKRHVDSHSRLPDALTVYDAISDLPPVERGQQTLNYTQKPKNIYQKERRKDLNDLTLHKAASHSDKMMEVIRHSGDNINCIPKHLITSGFSSCYSRLSKDEPATTITVKFQSPASSKCIHPTQHRTITPREAARIQSFDDNFVFKGSLTQISNQIGNAVPPLLGKAIAKTVFELLI